MLYSIVHLHKITPTLCMEHEHNTHEQKTISIKKRGDNLSIPLAITFAGILIAGAIIFSDTAKPKIVAEQRGQVPTREQVGADTTDAPVDILALRADDHILGNPKANVVIIEWSDTECPFCKRFHETMNQVIDQYGKSGDVAWVYRHSPIDQLHPKARKEAEALECANEQGGNDAFWKYTNKLFEVTPGNNGLDVAMLPKIAEMVGLDSTKLMACVNSGKYTAHIQSDFENGANAGVRGTPFSIIWNRKTNAQKPLSGAYPFDNVKALLGIVAAAPVTK